MARFHSWSLENVEYSFITITFTSTMIWSGNISYLKPRKWTTVVNSTALCLVKTKWYLVIKRKPASERNMIHTSSPVLLRLLIKIITLFRCISLYWHSGTFTLSHIISLNPPTWSLSITGLWNVSLPSGASPWNSIFWGRVEGQNITI